MAWRILALATVAALVCACGGNGENGGNGAPAGDRQYPYKIVATVGMVTDIVRVVAGDRAEVTGIVKAGIDPHLYKPTRNDIARLSSADVVFYSGLMLEGKMGDVLEQLGQQRPVYAVTTLIDEQYLLYPDEKGGHPDPHVWMDVTSWSKAVEAVAERLAEFDPDNAAYYRQNAEAYRGRLAELHEWAVARMQTIPEEQRVLITAHDAFNYFGRAYGVQVEGVQGLSTESEAGLQRIASLVDMIVERQVGAVFIESSVSEKNIRALIEGAEKRGQDVRVGGELYSDAMGPKGAYEGTYFGMIDHNVTTIVRALGGDAPAGGMQGKLTASGGDR